MKGIILNEMNEWKRNSDNTNSWNVNIMNIRIHFIACDIGVRLIGEVTSFKCALVWRWKGSGEWRLCQRNATRNCFSLFSLRQEFPAAAHTIVCLCTASMSYIINASRSVMNSFALQILHFFPLRSVQLILSLPSSSVPEMIYGILLSHEFIIHFTFHHRIHLGIKLLRCRFIS